MHTNHQSFGGQNVFAQKLQIGGFLSKKERKINIVSVNSSRCTLNPNVSIYLRVFVCLFAVNAKTTEQIDAKRSGITKNNPESVLRGLKSPISVLSGRYRDISGFSLAANHHFTYISSTTGSCLDA